ncbi:MAG: hypothetical protein RL642_833, partial [Bacteroidota bacterium]
MNNSYKIILVFTLFSCFSNTLFSQFNIGTWQGIARQGRTEYTYAINITKIDNDNIYGTTISSSNNFFSETKFKGVVKGNGLQLIETELVKTNYKGVGSVCLMTLTLTR